MKEIEKQIDRKNIPQHIAIIMDGNGRWAKKQGLLRTAGHKSGVNAVREAMQACNKMGVSYLTLYAFSTENWNRPKLEVNTLMSLLMKTIENEIQEFINQGIRLNVIGQIEKIPEKPRKILLKALEQTKYNTKSVLTIALSYGSQDEIIRMVKKIAKQVKNNELELENIDLTTIDKNLYTHDLPPVDLLIRTSGETRISNFLLWQIAYAELYFTPILWPDFTQNDLFEAILNYQNRERRYGKITEQIQKK